MARYVLEVMYDGTCFHGSQIQGDLPTVQLFVNKAISTLLRAPINTFGASRTDEGVHALSNFYHFDTDIELQDSFLYKCNAIMPEGLAAKRVYRALAPEFNARFDAVQRSYRYKIYSKKNPFRLNRGMYYPFNIDPGMLELTAVAITEYTNFESFAKRNSQTATFNCTIQESRWEFHAEEWHYVVVANRFLRGMVRGLVATQLHIARSVHAIHDFRNIVEAKDCTKARFNVPGYGLYLENIKFPDDAIELLFEK